MPDVAAVLRDGKIVADPADVIAAANASGLPLPALAAKLLRESYGGRNVFGNDRVAYPTSGPYTAATEAVTRPAVDAYLRWRGKAGANRGRQNGVGPSQLTWAELQDQAEAEGGLHVPRVNMTVGARELARCLKAGGGSWREAGARYNGGRAYGDPKTTEAAREYGRWLEDAVADWSRRLSGIAVPTVPTSSNGGGGRRTLKRGDNGADVADLQRVLARWYPDLHLAADGDYGPATEGAVRRLQAGSRPPLTVDGIAGRQVYGALGMS